MKVFVSYKFSGVDLNEVTNLLTSAQDALEAAGHDPYMILFDKSLEEARASNALSSPDFFFYGLKQLAASDIVLVLLVSEERSEGMLMEVGYALARGTPVVVAQKEDVKNTYLPQVGTTTFTWANYQDLAKKIKEIDSSSLKARQF